MRQLLVNDGAVMKKNGERVAAMLVLLMIGNQEI
jgi:hypothetical protein